MSSHYPIGVLGYLLMLAISIPAAAQVSYIDHTKQLSATFNDITLEDALSEIANLTGIEVLTSADLTQKININYESIALEPLLKRLLQGHNAIYVMDQKTHQLKTVRIFSRAKALPIASTPSHNPPINDHIAHNENGKYYLTVTLNGRPVRLLVDTGANTLALSQQLAASLGLTYADSVTIHTASGSTIGSRTTVKNLTMAGQTLTDVEAVILPQMQENGLLGQNVLSHFRHVSENGTILFEPVKKAEQQPQNSPNASDNPDNPEDNAPDNKEDTASPTPQS